MISKWSKCDLLLPFKLAFEGGHKSRQKTGINREIKGNKYKEAKTVKESSSWKFK